MVFTKPVDSIGHGLHVSCLRLFSIGQWQKRVEVQHSQNSMMTMVLAFVLRQHGSSQAGHDPSIRRIILVGLQFAMSSDSSATNLIRLPSITHFAIHI